MCPCFYLHFLYFHLVVKIKKKDINVQLIFVFVFIHSFIHTILSIGSQFQHVSIFIHIKANDVIDDVIQMQKKH